MPGEHEKGKVTSQGLRNIEKKYGSVDRAWARKEYRELSKQARAQVDQSVDGLFGLEQGFFGGRKLDPKKPADRPLIQEWLKVRDRVMAWHHDWEKQVADQKKIRVEEKKLIDKDMREIDRYLSVLQKVKQDKSIMGMGQKKFSRYIEKELKSELWLEKDNRSLSLTSVLDGDDLKNAVRGKEGKKTVSRLYQELVTGSVNQAEQQQAERILRAIGGLQDLKRVERQRLADQIPIIPAKFTIFSPAHITATVTKDGLINVKLPNQVLGEKEFRSETRRLPASAFKSGMELKPEQWVAFKLYDEGGITIYRPALYLLDLSNKSTNETWNNIFNVGSLGLPGGLILRGGGLVAKGVGRAVEKVLDVVASTLLVSNIVVREARGWIIKNFGSEGRRFVETWDRAATYAGVYGVSKMILTGAIGGLKSSWKSIKSESKGLSGSDLEKFKGLDRSVQAFVEKGDEALNELRRVRASAGREPHPSAPDTIPDVDTPTLKRTQGDTVSDATLSRPPRSPSPPVEPPQRPPGGPADRPPPGGGGGGTTVPPPYSEELIRLLGDDLARQAARIGINQTDLQTYLRLIIRNEHLHGRSGDAFRQIAAGHIARYATLRDHLARRLAGYGYDPIRVAQSIDTLQGTGLSMNQIRHNFSQEVKLMDYLKDSLSAGSLKDARTVLHVAEGDVRQAIRTTKWGEYVARWNRRHPRQEPGQARLQEFGERADRFVKRLERSLLGGTAPISGLIMTRKKDTKPPRKTDLIPDREAGKSREKLRIKEALPPKRSPDEVPKEKVRPKKLM